MKFIHFSFITFASVLMLVGLSSAAKSNVSIQEDEAKIRDVVNTFMHCLTEKDSVKFYNLFYDGPVTWVGVYADATQQKRIQKDSTLKSYKLSTYKDFYRSMYEDAVKEEQFEYLHILTDGNIGSVTFDYSFWVNGKKGNWGTEHWGMVKVNGEWKISSVIFSIELEKVKPQPKK